MKGGGVKLKYSYISGDTFGGKNKKNDVEWGCWKGGGMGGGVGEC